MGFIFIHSGIRQRADKPTGSTACHCTCRSTGRSRCEPTGGNDRTYTRDRKHAETCQEASRSADNSADTCTRGGSFTGIALGFNTVMVSPNDTDIR
jgi:hypothetical protein